MEQAQPKFEHAALEQDIQRLSAEIKERGLTEQGREAVKTVIKEQVVTMPPAGLPQAGAPVPASPLPNYLQSEPPAVKLQVEQLLDLAVHKGVKKAIAAAWPAGPLVLDALHDALADKLYEELKQRKLI